MYGKKFYNKIYEIIEEALATLSSFERGMVDGKDAFIRIRAISDSCMENGYEKKSIMDGIPEKEQMEFRIAIRELSNLGKLIQRPNGNPEVRRYLEDVKSQIGKLITEKGLSLIHI